MLVARLIRQRIEQIRAYGEMRPYLAAGLFEERLRDGLKTLQASLPAGTRVAYFNTHAVCDEKLTPEQQAAATSRGNFRR